MSRLPVLLCALEGNLFLFNFSIRKKHPENPDALKGTVRRRIELLFPQ